MSNWCKIACVINSWNLAVSQCYQSCPVGPISLDFEYPHISNKSSVVRYPPFVCLSPNSSVYHASYFLPDGSSPSISFFFNWACHASLNVLGSVGPDITAEIRQVS